MTDEAKGVKLTEEAPVCPFCGEEFRLVWIGHDPPEPYGDVCGCPEAKEELRWASAEKNASDHEAAAGRQALSQEGEGK
jgi:hypothetical protein